MVCSESYKDCANLEDRRDIDRVALCALHHGPSVGCPEFNARSGNVNAKDSHENFCMNCASFEEIGGVAICAREHRPWVACAGFDSKAELVTVQ